MVAKPLLDPIVVEDGESDGRLADPAWTNQSNWSGALSEVNYLLDQFVATKDGPRWWGRRFSGYTRLEYQILGPTSSLDC